MAKPNRLVRTDTPMVCSGVRTSTGSSPASRLPLERARLVPGHADVVEQRALDRRDRRRESERRVEDREADLDAADADLGADQPVELGAAGLGVGIVGVEALVPPVRARGVAADEVGAAREDPELRPRPARSGRSRAPAWPARSGRRSGRSGGSPPSPGRTASRRASGRTRTASAGRRTARRTRTASCRTPAPATAGGSSRRAD